MDPLHATIEEFAADGYTHVECFCPRCRMTRSVGSLASRWDLPSRNCQHGYAVPSAVVSRYGEFLMTRTTLKTNTASRAFDALIERGRA